MFRCSRKLGFCFLFLSFFLFICFRLPQAQASIFGTVRGIVHDVQHRPIPGARVELRFAWSWLIHHCEGPLVLDLAGTNYANAFRGPPV